MKFSDTGFSFLHEHGAQEAESRENQDSDEWTIYVATVFHLEVEESHTFFIGKTGLLVHDASMASKNVAMNRIDQDHDR